MSLVGPRPERASVNAAELIAEGEFNRFYLRALCLAALSQDIPVLVINRARHSDHPRPESEAQIGTHIDVAPPVARPRRLATRICCARRVISSAARRVKVNSNKRRGSAPPRISRATRWANVLVLPVSGARSDQ